MTKIYSKNDLNETLASKIYRWLVLNYSNVYILKHNDGSKVFVDTDLGILFDKDTFEAVEIKELSKSEGERT